VDISFNKTHISLTTYEFAKRWFRRGHEITGLPLGGIIRNYNNPKVVYTIVFEYFQRLSLTTSVFQFLYHCYNGVYVRRFGRFNYQKLFSHMRHYEMAVKFKNDLLTADQLRTYLVGILKDSAMALPLDLVPLIRESIFDGSLSLIHKNVNSLMSIKEDFIAKIFPKDSIDLNDLYSSPLVNSLSNFLARCIETIEHSSSEKDPRVVLESLSGIVLPDLDKLTLQVRNVQVRVAILDKVWKEAIYSISKRYETDQYFGSSTQVEIDYVNMSGHSRVVLHNLKTIRNFQIIPIVERTIVKPTS